MEIAVKIASHTLLNAFDSSDYSSEETEYESDTDSDDSV